MNKIKIKPVKHASFVSQLCLAPPVKMSTMLYKIYLWGTSERVLAQECVHSKKWLKPSLQGQTSPNQIRLVKRAYTNPPQ